MPRPTSIGPRPHRRCKNTSKKGTRAEHELRDKLRAEGHLVVNAKASKGPCDLLSLAPEGGTELCVVGCTLPIPGRTFLIEVKSDTAYMTIAEKGRLRTVAAQHGAVAVLAHRTGGLPPDQRWKIAAL